VCRKLRPLCCRQFASRGMSTRILDLFVIRERQSGESQAGATGSSASDECHSRPTSVMTLAVCGALSVTCRSTHAASQVYLSFLFDLQVGASWTNRNGKSPCFQSRASLDHGAEQALIFDGSREAGGVRLALIPDARGMRRDQGEIMPL